MKHKVYFYTLCLFGVAYFTIIESCYTGQANLNSNKVYNIDFGSDTTVAKIALGEKLFFDRRLSANGTKSCATCHSPTFAFTDGYRRSLGIYADEVRHNAPTLINTKFYASLTWANPNVKSYEQQAETPLFARHPPEMGLSSDDDTPLRRLSLDAAYRHLFKAAFGNSVSETAALIPPEVKKNNKNKKENTRQQADNIGYLFTYTHVLAALAAFESTLVSFQSQYDQYVAGDTTALSASAKRGQALFFSTRLQCGECHPPPLFSDADQAGKYHNVGLYCMDSIGSYPAHDEGLYEYTHQIGDKGKFRTPTLRNVALTAPYMHDGSISNLAAAIRIFEEGGQWVKNGPQSGNGRQNPNKDPRITGFELSNQERADLIAFLYSLTDTTLNKRIKAYF